MHSRTFLPLGRLGCFQNPALEEAAFLRLGRIAAAMGSPLAF